MLRRRPRSAPATDALELLPQPAVRVDAGGRLLHANDEWWQTRGADRLSPRRWVDQLSPDGLLRRALASGEPVDVVLPMSAVHREGWLRVRARAGDGERLLVLDDTTAERRAALLLHHEAMVEPLTGLPNRASLTRRLEQAMRPTPTPLLGTLMFVDLDRFKQVNDTYGHEVGDQVLRTIAARLRRVARVGDLVARLGGDEFVLLATGVADGLEAVRLADRVRHTVEQPVWVEGHPVQVGASIGTVLLEDCEDAAQALRQADVAMQNAKRARRGRDPGRLLTGARDPLRHTVSFYDDDALVVAEVADLVGGALTVGRRSVVIATPDHRGAVAAELGTRGVDHAAAVRDGRLLVLDAEDTLQAFLVDGWPDERRFADAIGRTVRGLLQDGSGLDAYGEMVSLLWQRGQTAAALRLEELWNDLLDEVPFRMHCAYAVADALAPPDVHGMHPVCVHHSHVL